MSEEAKMVVVPKLTSLTDLQEYSRGKVVELPEFSEGQPLIARLVRPSMLALVRQKKIPNSLLVSANELFKSGGKALDVDDENMLDDVFGIMDIICEASFIEPTYAEIKEAGVTLTDDQMMMVFKYSQEGVKALEPFRKK